MDFKKKFSQLRSGNYPTNSSILSGKQGIGQALFPEGYWFQDINKDQQALSSKEKVLSSEDFLKSSERDQTLDALEEFVVKKTETKTMANKKVSFKGGEIKLNKTDDSLSLLQLDYNNDELNLINTDSLESHDQIQFLFLGDNYLAEKHDDDLLNNMISAMKLTPDQYIRLRFEDKDSNSEEFKQMINAVVKHRPKLIISLGAISTNILLGKKERLSRIHGKIFERNIEFKSKSKASVKFMPLFHPDYLKINPNMKRSAWIDLQKAMEQISKL
jgi:hypothetical protein